MGLHLKGQLQWPRDLDNSQEANKFQLQPQNALQKILFKKKVANYAKVIKLA